MMKILPSKLLLLFLLPIALFVQCKEDVAVENELQASIISILAEDNETFLAKDYIINEDKATFEIELSETLKERELTIGVFHNADEASVGGVLLIGGKATLVLKEKNEIILQNSKGQQKVYELHVRFSSEQDLAITDLRFQKSLNPNIAEDALLTSSDGLLYVGKLNDFSPKHLILTFNSNASAVFVGHVRQSSGQTVNDFASGVDYKFIAPNGIISTIRIQVSWQVANAVPHISIHIVNDAEVTSKSTYLNASISIDGKGGFQDFSGNTEIRGRGNSTWSLPKKPYRLRLPVKAEILGLPEARNWVLLANYIDPTLMCNSVAMKIGRDLELPFTNTMIPVDLSINGTYRGSYVLTQQVEAHENRVNIGSTGVLLELDTYYDEDYQFRSANYNMPVMIKEPGLDNSSQIQPIKTDFQLFEDLVAANTFPDNSYKDLLDISSFTKFFIVQFLTGNEEFNHPKSIYLYKKPAGKYTFGPLWDFDWAFGYEGSLNHFTNPGRSFFWSNNAIGTRFFSRIFQDPAVKTEFKTNWLRFKNNHLDNLYTYIDDYALLIKDSHAKDNEKWGKGAGFDTKVSAMKTYIQNRAIFIDNFVQGF